MEKLYIPLPNEVEYCYAYDQPISFGNTSQGTLEVKWLRGMEDTLRRLVATGLRIVPWGNIGADLLGEVRYAMLQEMGLDMTCMHPTQGATAIKVTIKQSHAPTPIVLTHGEQNSILPPLLEKEESGGLYLYGEYATHYQPEVLALTGWKFPMMLQIPGDALLLGSAHIMENIAARLEALQ